MSGIDIEGVLSDHFVMLAELEGDGPPHEWRCQCGAKFGFSDSAIAHVAAVLREQLGSWIADFPWTETARDDLLSLLAAHLSNTERAGGAG